jgi:hypothetical protein
MFVVVHKVASDIIYFQNIPSNLNNSYLMMAMYQEHAGHKPKTIFPVQLEFASSIRVR